MRKKNVKKYYIFLIGLFLALPIYGQDTIGIMGSVVSANDGLPLPGVTVMEKGTNNGVVTDFDGNFSINASSDAILLISYVGFETLEIPVDGRTEINVKLEVDMGQLSEVVVVGYGTQEKKNLTGAVQTLSMDEAVNVPVTNSSQLMYGRFSGVQLTQGGGLPGSDNSSINIRGLGTFGNSNPLIVIDGMQYDGLREFNQLAPSDIEDITVLKDASAGAIYGARGANGVIVVTTRKGESGEFKVELNTYAGIQSPTVTPNLLNPVSYARLVNENLINLAGGNPDAVRYSDEDIELIRNGNDKDRFAQTNWTEEIVRDAPILNSYLSLSGGSEKTTYKVSLGYLEQDAIVEGKFSYERYNLRANISSQLNNWLSISNNFWGTMDKEASPNSGAGNILSFMRNPPTIPVRYSNGEYGSVDGSYYSSNPINIPNNPVQLGLLGDSEQEYYNINDRLSVKIDLLADLSFETSGSFSLYFQDVSNFIPYSEQKDWDGNVLEQSGYNSLTNRFNKRAVLLNENLLRYEKNIDDDHFISVLAGHTLSYTNIDGFRASIENFPSESLRELDSGGVTNPAVGGNRAEEALQSFFGRFSYRYKDRYLVEANFRRDGTSKFGPQNRYGNFPSLSVGWRLSEEPFLKSIREGALNSLKLRGSWGRTGNNGIGRYIYDQTYQTGLDYVLGEGRIVSGIALTALANSGIKWETSEQLDLGIDASFFNGKLNFVGDYFHRKSFDVLYTNFPIPSTIGVSSLAAENSAEILNEGIELNVNYRHHQGDFSYSLGANLTKMFPNKVLSLGGGVPTIGNNNIITEGEPYQAYYGYNQIGIFQSADEVENSPEQFGDPSVGPGDLKYADINGPDGAPDGIVDDMDRTVIGNPYPEFQYGLFANFSYSGLDFGVTFQGIQNVDRVLKNGAFLGFGNAQSNVLESWENRWTPENPSTNLHRLGGSRNNLQKLSTFYIQDASFLRLKNIEIGYSLPEGIIGKIGLRKLRVFVSGQNLLTFTKMEDFDPERMSGNIGTNSVPLYKIVNSGINLTF